MQTVRSLVAMAFQEDAELTTATFYGSIILSFGYTDDGFHLFLIWAFGDVINELFKDIHAFHDFVHTNHVACPGVAFGINDFFEVHFVVYSVGMAFTRTSPPSQLGGDLLELGSWAVLMEQLGVDLFDFVKRVHHMDGDTDGPGLVGNGTGNSPRRSSQVA